MPPFLSQLSEYGVLAAVMGCVFWITSLIIKKLPNKTDDSMSKTLERINSMIMAHNERAAVNQEITLKNFAIVLHDHEKMMEYLTRLIMSVSSQDTVMAGFKADISDIKCALSQISKKQYEMPHG